MICPIASPKEITRSLPNESVSGMYCPQNETLRKKSSSIIPIKLCIDFFTKELLRGCNW